MDENACLALSKRPHVHMPNVKHADWFTHSSWPASSIFPILEGWQSHEISLVIHPPFLGIPFSAKLNVSLLFFPSFEVIQISAVFCPSVSRLFFPRNFMKLGPNIYHDQRFAPEAGSSNLSGKRSIIEIHSTGTLLRDYKINQLKEPAHQCWFQSGPLEDSFWQPLTTHARGNNRDKEFDSCLSENIKKSK